MQVLFVLRFYPSDKTDKLDRFIPASGSKMAVKMNSVVKQLMYVLKLFRVSAGSIHSFRIHSEETLRITYLKYPVLLMMERIHFRCGSFGAIIRFWILVKKRNIRLRIKNPDLVFSKETHPMSLLICRSTYIGWCLDRFVNQNHYETSPEKLETWLTLYDFACPHYSNKYAFFPAVNILIPHFFFHSMSQRSLV